jgi:hypothetical protein
MCGLTMCGLTMCGLGRQPMPANKRGKLMKERIASLSIPVLLGLLVVQLIGSAVAQQPNQAQANAIRQSCRSDYQSYCSSVPTGGMASLQCLQGHLSELSPPCQSAVGNVSGGGSSRGPSSSGQVASPSSAPPRSAPPSSAAASSAPPNSAPPPMPPREKMAMMRRACGGDFRAYCRGVPLGGGEAMRCLADNQSRLSPPCRDVMAAARGSR